MKAEYEWSESGRKLLETIINEINEIGGVRPTYHQIMLENSRNHREIVKVKKCIYQRITKMRTPYKMKMPKISPNFFSEKEFAIISANITMPSKQLIKLLPNRDYDSVRTTACKLRASMNFVRFYMGLSPLKVK